MVRAHHHEKLQDKQAPRSVSTNSGFTYARPWEAHSKPFLILELHKEYANILEGALRERQNTMIDSRLDRIVLFSSNLPDAFSLAIIEPLPFNRLREAFPTGC